MGVPALAEYLGVTQRLVYKLIDQGQLPAYKLGRVIRVRRVDAEAYLEANRVRPGSLSHLYPPGYGARNGQTGKR